MVRGQGSGIITAARRDIFFHKSDVRGAFWELNPGDKVVFELLEDQYQRPTGAERQSGETGSKDPLTTRPGRVYSSSAFLSLQPFRLTALTKAFPGEGC